VLLHAPQVLGLVLQYHYVLLQYPQVLWVLLQDYSYEVLGLVLQDSELVWLVLHAPQVLGLVLQYPPVLGLVLHTPQVLGLVLQEYQLVWLVLQYYYYELVGVAWVVLRGAPLLNLVLTENRNHHQNHQQYSPMAVCSIALMSQLLLRITLN